MPSSSINLCACGDGRGLLIYFMLGSKLMHFIWNIALSFLGIRARPLCCHQSLPSADDWVTACTGLQHRSLQHQPGTTAEQKCSIPGLWLVGGLTFHNPYWSNAHEPLYMCTDLCCMLGFSLASQWLLSGASDWPECCSEGPWLAEPLTLHSPFCQSSRVRKCGPGMGEIARYLAKWNQR